MLKYLGVKCHVLKLFQMVKHVYKYRYCILLYKYSKHCSFGGGRGSLYCTFFQIIFLNIEFFSNKIVGRSSSLLRAQQKLIIDRKAKCEMFKKCKN